MSEMKYRKYVVRTPKIISLDYHPTKNVKGVTFPDEVYMDGELVSGCPLWVDIGWRFEIPDPDPVEWTHSHEFDEVLCFIGTDPKNPHDLGGEIEFHIGDEVYSITTTSAIYIPKGLKHCPFMHKRVDRPFLLVAIGLTDHYPEALETGSG